jgi:predicted TIM-barrel fold metal-dependent hydrolase
MRAPGLPAWRAPAKVCDTHFHIFGPYDRFPLAQGRKFTPAEASIGAYTEMREHLGLERGVVVQPSIYGRDNRCTLDAVKMLGAERMRAVVVIDDSVGRDEIMAMHAAGARGVRCNTITGIGDMLAQIERIAENIAEFGWHLQLYTRGEDLPDLAPRLAALPVPVVYDHMGRIRTEWGLDSPSFRALLGQVGSGRAWVKLCGYRISSAGQPYADVAPFARALIAAAPERCVWGTDWPHPSMGDATPDDVALFDLLGEWAPDDETRRRILVDNPVHLYGFDP